MARGCLGSERHFAQRRPDTKRQFRATPFPESPGERSNYNRSSGKRFDDRSPVGGRFGTGPSDDHATCRDASLVPTSIPSAHRQTESVHRVAHRSSEELGLGRLGAKVGKAHRFAGASTRRLEPPIGYLSTVSEVAKPEAGGREALAKADVAGPSHLPLHSALDGEFNDVRLNFLCETVEMPSGQCLMGEFCCGGQRSCDRDGRQQHSPHKCNMCDPDRAEQVGAHV